MLTKHFLAAAGLATLSPSAEAHRMWMLPSTTVVSGTDNWVTVDAAVSNDLFYADHQPARLEQVKVWQPDGTPGVLQNASTGRYRSTFDVALDKPGTWKIGTMSSNVTGSFKLDGEQRRVGGRFGGMRPGGPESGPRAGGPASPAGAGVPGRTGAEGGFRGPPPVAVADIPANATDVKLTEMVTRNEIFVTAGEPTITIFTPSAKGLELQPITHPDELVSGQAAQFRFLIDGKPAPNLKVTVIPGGKRYRNGEDGMELTTGADGVLKVTWPAAGMYWLNAIASDDKPSEPRATERRLSYVTTLEVMTP